MLISEPGIHKDRYTASLRTYQKKEVSVIFTSKLKDRMMRGKEEVGRRINKNYCECCR